MLGFRRADLLARAMESLRASSAERDWELVLVLNGALPPVQEYALRALEQADFPLAVLESSSLRPGAARNLGVAEARAPLLLFLDDDIECFQDLPARVKEIFAQKSIQAAGGANLTPPDSGPLARATGYAMATWLGAARMRARYAKQPDGPCDEHSLILCNLAVRRSFFESQRGFAPHLVSNEENVLLQRLGAAGARQWRDHGLAVYHRRRETWRGLAEQAAKYGAGRAQNLLLLPASFRSFYFLPLLALFYGLSLPAGFLAWGSAYLAPAALYALLALGATAAAATRYRDPAAALMVLVYPVLHLAYGFGFARALPWAFRRKRLMEYAPL